jgi:hypothetical protein
MERVSVLRRARMAVARRVGWGHRERKSRTMLHGVGGGTRCDWVEGRMRMSDGVMGRKNGVGSLREVMRGIEAGDGSVAVASSLLGVGELGEGGWEARLLLLLLLLLLLSQLLHLQLSVRQCGGTGRSGHASVEERRIGDEVGELAMERVRTMLSHRLLPRPRPSRRHNFVLGLSASHRRHPSNRLLPVFAALLLDRRLRLPLVVLALSRLRTRVDQLPVATETSRTGRKDGSGDGLNARGGGRSNDGCRPVNWSGGEVGGEGGLSGEQVGRVGDRRGEAVS